MARKVDEVLWRVWRERLVRYESSGQRVAAFCARERVTASAFYQWRRKLAGMTSLSAATTAGRTPATGPARFVPVRIESSGCVELVLGNGTRVRVPTHELTALEAVVRTAGGLPLSLAAEGASC